MKLYSNLQKHTWFQSLFHFNVILQHLKQQCSLQWNTSLQSSSNCTIQRRLIGDIFGGVYVRRVPVYLCALFDHYFYRRMKEVGCWDTTVIQPCSTFLIVLSYSSKKELKVQCFNWNDVSHLLDISKASMLDLQNITASGGHQYMTLLEPHQLWFCSKRGCSCSAGRTQ